MGISVSGAEVKPGYNNERLPELGEHLCKVRNVRESNGFKGDTFWIDLEVIEGPSPKGFQFSWGNNPENATFGPKMPKAKAVAREKGKIVACVGAVYGFNEKLSEESIKDPEYAASIDQSKGLSPLAGRYVIVSNETWSNPNTNATGRKLVFKPYLKDGVSPYAGGGEAPKPNLPKSKAQPDLVKKPTFDELLAKHGFERHADDPTNYVHDGENVLTIDEFKAKFEE